MTNNIILIDEKSKKSIKHFSLEVFLDQLTNNQSETKAKINSEIKLCPQKITKNRFKVLSELFLTKLNGSFLKAQHL